MQQIPLILIALAALGIVLLHLRRRWPHLLPRTRKFFLSASILAILVFLSGYATGWVTVSDRFNAAVYGAAIAGYLLLLTVHSLNRPRWLTSATAIILAAPIFGSSLFLPLAGIFHPSPRRIQQLDGNLYVSWQRFTEVGPASNGVDLDIFYRPARFPFLHHTRLGGRFYNLQCDGDAIQVTLQPDRESVFVRCPSWPNSADSDPGSYLRLHR